MDGCIESMNIASIIQSKAQLDIAKPMMLLIRKKCSYGNMEFQIINITKTYHIIGS